MLKAKHLMVAAALALPLGLASPSAFAVTAHNAQSGGDSATNVNESSMKTPGSGGMMMMKKHHMKKKHKMMKKNMM